MNKKAKGIIGVIMGAALLLFGVYLIRGTGTGGFVPLIIGAGLIYVSWTNSRKALVLFGHLCIFAGAYLITWGIYLIPVIKPPITIAHIFSLPLFWGIFATGGGVCAIFHGMCNCVRNFKTNCKT